MVFTMIVSPLLSLYFSNNTFLSLLLLLLLLLFKAKKLMLCECCDYGFHYDCLGLLSLPETDFFCSICEKKKHEYTFINNEGENTLCMIIIAIIVLVVVVILLLLLLLLLLFALFAKEEARVYIY